MGSGTAKLQTVSLFSGGGGLDLGIEAVGFSTLFASDIDQRSCETLVQNREKAKKGSLSFLEETLVHQNSIEDLDPQFILDSIKLKQDELDLLIGGPPCQAFSVFGKRKGREDPRGRLVYEYLKILRGLRPKAFMFENVYGLLTVENGLVYKEVTKQLANPADDLSYTLSIHRLNAADYGVPQFRDRIFIIGHRGGITIDKIPQLTFDPKTKSEEQLRWRTVQDGLKGLLGANPDYPANHTGRKHSQRIIDRYSNLVAGERDPKTRINKLDLNRPSFTIIVGSDNGGGKGHVHPIEPREVTPRESARMQTFPDWWSFAGNRTSDSIRQIGNAVPPLLAAAIGNEIRYKLFGLERILFKEVVERLDQKHLYNDEELAILGHVYEEFESASPKQLSLAI